MKRDGTLTNREMLRQAFETLGYEAVPSVVGRWITETFGKVVKRPTISAEKHWMKRERDWVVEALQELGADADPAQVQTWLRTKKGEERSKEYLAGYLSGIRRRRNPTATNGKVDVQVGLEAPQSAKIAGDALALLQRVKAFAAEVGGVERLRQILDMLK